MTIIEAEKFARTKTIKATLIILALLTVLFLIGETRGDFANGILFFLQAIINETTIIFSIILFGLTYYFVGQAGKEVILEKKNILLITVKYATLISLAICLAAIIGFFRLKDFSANGFGQIVKSYFLPMFFKTVIFLVAVWLWSTNKMKVLQVK